jgi:hypothetical protein
LLRSAATSLLLLAGLARAEGLAERCTDASRALVFQPVDVPDKAERVMETELAVEARRLKLDACRTVVGHPAVVAQVTWSPDNARLEVTVGSRILGRDVALGSDAEGNVLELALILGDLVREAVSPTTPVDTAPSPRWTLGVRGTLEAFPAGPSVFFGGDLVARAQWHLLALELAAGGRTTREAAVSAGQVSLESVGGEVLGLFTLFHLAHARLHLEGGARAAALALSASATAPSTAQPRWAATVELRAGLALDVPVGPLELRATVGGAFPALGAAALADGKTALGVVGPGVFGSLGLAFGSGGAP